MPYLQVAFLAAIMGPEVAAAAAQKALQVLTVEDPTDSAGIRGDPGAGDGESAGSSQQY